MASVPVDEPYKTIISLKTEAEVLHVGCKALWWVVLSFHTLSDRLDSQDSLDPGPVHMA